MFSLKGRRALVTGAGNGLGKHFAQALGRAGAEVLCTDSDIQTATATAASIGPNGTGVARALDVTNGPAVSALADHLRSERRPVDILVNNAGIATFPVRTHELADADWDRLMAVSLRGVFLCSKALLPSMIEQSRGTIINVSSILALRGYYPDFPATTVSYAAAKAAIVGMTKQTAVEYAAEGIRVNAICPGWHVGTNLGRERRATSTKALDDAFDAAVAGRTPMGRKGQPEELEGLVVYLASDASRFVTGQVFVHDGGWTAA